MCVLILLKSNFIFDKEVDEKMIKIKSGREKSIDFDPQKEKC